MKSFYRDLLISFIKYLKMNNQGTAGQAVMEYIIVFIVITLVIGGFIVNAGGIFDNYFQATITRVLG